MDLKWYTSFIAYFEHTMEKKSDIKQRLVLFNAIVAYLYS